MRIGKEFPREKLPNECRAIRKPRQGLVMPDALQNPLVAKANQIAESNDDKTNGKPDENGLAKVLARSKRESFPGQKEPPTGY